MTDLTPIFRNDYNQYRRDLNFISLYLDQCETYAKIQDNTIDTKAYRHWMNEQLKKDGQFPLFNPRMKMVLKNEVNDRERGVITVLDYFKQVQQQDLKFAPTFTTYRPEYVQRSLESSFLTVGSERRGIEKKNKFKAKEAGNDELAEYHDNMQLMLKVQNNSSSGAKATAGTIQYNQTGHSTLTSICRSTTSFANSTNERFLGGYRHYYNVEVVINNILAILTYCSEEETRRVMDKYQLHYVRPDELIQAIKRSTDIYWRAPNLFKQIEEFVVKLTPLQCSMYLYNSDLYHLREFNDEVIRKWYGKLLSYQNLTPLPLEEAEAWIDIMDADLAALIAVYVADYCNGKSVKTALTKNPEIKPHVGAVIKNTIEVFEHYRDLIRCFWVTDMMPFETAHVPHMMRGIVLGSDTDSSLFTLDKFWVQWYTGNTNHTKEAMDVVGTTVYLTSQHIAHILGLMTGIINIVDEKKPLIAMKNEFLFSSFTTTSRGKHYFAKKDAQEGIMIDRAKMESEIKGVGLKHTKVPAHITKGFHEELNLVMNTIEQDGKISILERTKHIAQLEHEIYTSIQRGEPTYLQRAQVKVKDAYKNENSPYKRGYLLWEDVFAPKYGHTVEPPYDCILVSLKTDTKSRFNTWVSSFEDRVLADRLLKWVEDNNEGRPLKTFYIPQAVATSVGIPTEFMSVMEPRKLVYKIVAPYYLLTESFGSFMVNNHITRLYSDDFPGWVIPTSLSLSDNDDDEDDGLNWDI